MYLLSLGLEYFEIWPFDWAKFDGFQEGVFARPIICVQGIECCGMTFNTERELGT